MAFCTQCGKQIETSQSFCTRCGKQIKADQGSGYSDNTQIAQGSIKPNENEIETSLKVNDEQAAIMVPVDGATPSIDNTDPIAKSPSELPSASAPVAVKAATVMAKDFRCNSCGTPLKIPRNSKGIVRCPSCKTECVIEGLVKNAEIAAKQNINSGVSLSATPATLHRQLLSTLSKLPYAPLDVFDKIEVIREECYCVPAYCFYCSGTSPYTYVTYTKDTRQDLERRGDTIYAVTKTDTKPHDNQGIASIEESLFSSGEKSMASQIHQLYNRFDVNMLEDVEELEFPPDIVTFEYNLTQLATFNQYIKPRMEELLHQKVYEILKGKQYSNMKITGTTIQKEITRVYLGLYCVVCRYGSREYSMWATGDGQKGWLERAPVDPIRQTAYDEKKAKASGFTKDGGPGCFLTILGLFFGLCSLVGGFSRDNVVGGLFFLLLAGACFIPKAIMAGKHNDQLAKDKSDFEAFDAQRHEALQRFRQNKKALRGIYKEVTGDPEAF